MIYLRCDIAGGVKVLTWFPEQAVLLVLGSHSQKCIQCDHCWPITRIREVWHWTDSWNMRTRTLRRLQCELWGSWSWAGWNTPWEEQSSGWLPQEVLSNCCDTSRSVVKLLWQVPWLTHCLYNIQLEIPHQLTALRYNSANFWNVVLQVDVVWCHHAVIT